jgi:2-oxoglutarate dehydrogenase complex dehydrogenase (E1) component-like enzyme
MNVILFTTKDYENKTAFRLEQNKPKQSQGIKRVRSIFRRFILTILTQASHINITTPIVDRKRDPSQNEQKEPKKNQVSVLTMGVGIFSSFFFAAEM